MRSRCIPMFSVSSLCPLYFGLSATVLSRPRHRPSLLIRTGWDQQTSEIAFVSAQLVKQTALIAAVMIAVGVHSRGQRRRDPTDRLHPIYSGRLSSTSNSGPRSGCTKSACLASPCPTSSLSCEPTWVLTNLLTASYNYLVGFVIRQMICIYLFIKLKWLINEDSFLMPLMPSLYINGFVLEQNFTCLTIGSSTVESSLALNIFAWIIHQFDWIFFTLPGSWYSNSLRRWSCTWMITWFHRVLFSQKDVQIHVGPCQWIAVATSSKKLNKNQKLDVQM